MNTQDTICAIATAPGGAIGIIRVSGAEAITIADRIFTPVGNHAIPLSERSPYTLAFGHIKSDRGEIIDEVLVSIFRAPHSYTGEDSVEISCHGSSYILQQVMQQLIQNGCRAAGPGEYTQRAFLNGKMDLSQAEAVADLIASKSAAAHKMAINQMRGSFSRELSALRDKLLHLTSLMELELDFSDHEELEFADRSELLRITQEIEQVITRLVNSFSTGKAIKEGLSVAIVGPANAGKSSLLNRLVDDDRAIVSDIPGTTRDVIEDTMTIHDRLFRFIDTAGLRDTADRVEQLGIERSHKEIEKADIVLWVMDVQTLSHGASSLSGHEKTMWQQVNANHNHHLLLVYNKCDQYDGPSPHPSMSADDWHVDISAKTGDGIDNLRNELYAFAVRHASPDNDVIVSNVRHYNALNTALDAIHRVQQSLADGIPTDLVSIDLHDCLNSLAEITGGCIETEEVLGNIFKNFCIGK